MAWFEQTFGFRETPEAVQRYFERQVTPMNAIVSKVNGRIFPAGKFTTVSVKDLRDLVQMDSLAYDNTVKYEHITIGDVLELHHKHPGALFQAASQFNCLEMPSSSVGPEAGVSGYVCDRTQGPACALACAAGTVWRNYFVDIIREDGTVQQGQTFDAQINCLEDLESILGNKKLWKLTNGYLFSSNNSMETFAEILKNRDRDILLEQIKIGLHYNVPVNFVSRNWEEPSTDIRVHQAYCSAVPCAYDRAVTADKYEPLARLILDAEYEGTLLAAKALGVQTVFLTLVGAGVFGNKKQWVAAAIARALKKVGHGLDIKICHYMLFDKEFENMIKQELK